MGSIYAQIPEVTTGGVLKKFANFKGKHLCWSLFYIKIIGWSPRTLFKKRFQHNNFRITSTKFLIASIL